MAKEYVKFSNTHLEWVTYHKDRSADYLYCGWENWETEATECRDCWSAFYFCYYGDTRYYIKERHKSIESLHKIIGHTNYYAG